MNAEGSPIQLLYASKYIAVLPWGREVILILRRLQLKGENRTDDHHGDLGDDGNDQARGRGGGGIRTNPALEQRKCKNFTSGIHQIAPF